MKFRLSRNRVIQLFIVSLIGFIVSLPSMAQSSQSARTESAGQVIIASGPFQAQTSSETLRQLSRGSNFYSGETLKTGTNSTAQVRFTDGTVMALSPNSQVRVDEYSYHQDAKSDKSVTTLVKGGFRALTGLISKENPDAYKLQTPVAVIGVRGTNYGGVIKGGKLFAGVWKGEIYVKNDGGLIQLGRNNDYNYTAVLAKNSAPIGLLYPPAELVGQCGVTMDRTR